MRLNQSELNIVFIPSSAASIVQSHSPICDGESPRLQKLADIFYPKKKKLLNITWFYKISITFNLRDPIKRGQDPDTIPDPLVM